MKLKRRKKIEASPSPSERVDITGFGDEYLRTLKRHADEEGISMSISRSIEPTASVEASESLPPEEEGVEWAYAKKTVYSTNTKPVYVSNAKRAKCHYCGLWGDRQTTCAHCGASID